MLAVLIGGGGHCRQAVAQTSFGEAGDFAIAFERVAGLYSARQNNEDIAGLDAFRYGYVELGIQGRVDMPSSSARLGFDIFVMEGLSLGGNVGFASYGEDLGTSLFLLAPRVGYFFPFTDTFGVWPRLGLTYYTMHTPDRWQFMLTGEAMFTISPSEGVAFLVGPMFDLGFAGPDGRRERIAGLTAGVAVLF